MSGIASYIVLHKQSREHDTSYGFEFVVNTMGGSIDVNLPPILP